MSNAAYTLLPTSEKKAEPSLPTYPGWSQAHGGSSDGATPPPSAAAAAAAEETPLPENLCYYTVIYPGEYESCKLISEKGSSKADIIDKLSSISPDILARAALDSLRLQVYIDGEWCTVSDLSFDEVIVKGRPNKIRIVIKPSWAEWWRYERKALLILFSFVVGPVAFVFLMYLLFDGRSTSRQAKPSPGSRCQ